MNVILKGSDIRHHFTLSALSQKDDKKSFFITSPLLGNNVEIKFVDGPSFDESFRSIKLFSKRKTIENLKKHILSMRQLRNLTKCQAKFCYSFLIRIIDAKSYSDKADYIKNGFEKMQEMIPDLDIDFPELSKNDIGAIESAFMSSRTGFEYPEDVSLFRSKYWDEIVSAINHEIIGKSTKSAFA